MTQGNKMIMTGNSIHGTVTCRCSFTIDGREWIELKHDYGK